MKSSKPAVIATILIFVLAITALLIMVLSGGGDDKDPNGNGGDGVFVPSEELFEEMDEAAKTLTANNYLVARLYTMRGLPVIPEPYASEEKPLGNSPSDGYYYVDGSVTVDGKQYTSLSDVEGLVDATFSPEEADRIKNNRTASGSAYYNDFGKIYSEKAPNANGYALGINEAFALYVHPFPDGAVSDLNWVSPRYEITPISNDTCELVVFLQDLSGAEVKFERTMVYINNQWYLDRLIYSADE